MNPIPYYSNQPHGYGYIGYYAGEYHLVMDPQELLDNAYEQFPTLLFQLVETKQ